MKNTSLGEGSEADLANTNICEQVEIAILSDEKLTDEQIAHIENCQSCKNFLLQTQKMKNDLSQLSVPGIKHSEISERVMKQLRLQKRKARSKIKWTNHIGTAAAAVIILVAALIIKDPVQELNTSKDSTVEMSGNSRDIDEAHHFISQNGVQVTDNENDAVDTMPDAHNYVSMNGIDNEGDDDTNDGANRERIESTTRTDIVTMPAKTNTQESVESDNSEVNSENVQVTLSSDDPFDDYNDDKKVNSTVGSATPEIVPNDVIGSDAITDNEQKVCEEIKVFEGVQFLEGEANLEQNMDIADNHLNGLGIELAVNRSYISLNSVSNSAFIEELMTLTEGSVLTSKLFIKK